VKFGRPCTACDGQPFPFSSRAIPLAHANAVPPPPHRCSQTSASLWSSSAPSCRSTRARRSARVATATPSERSHPSPFPLPRSPRRCFRPNVAAVAPLSSRHSPCAFRCVSARFAVTCLWVLSTSKRSYGDGENWDSGEIGENIPASGPYVIYS
jgi:hypothetical protein